MSLGNKILELRKKKGLSQEQLGEKIEVTRQTISNWELGQTTPNPDQLKLLSNALNISIDELLNNNIKNTLVEKVSNTEKLAHFTIKILKFIGVAFITLFIIDLIVLILFLATGKMPNVESSATTICNIKDNQYIIEFGTDQYFKCENCSDSMTNEIKKLVDFNNIDSSIENLEKYFKSKKGNCES